VGRSFTIHGVGESVFAMNRLLIFIGMTAGGYVGWWAGEYIGLELMGTFLVSSCGSIAGVFLAWKIGRDFLDG
jgi:hypothetical protein